ncbi:MAG: class II aldolase/adducin family protein [Candidatus Omnitrophica bacterium]|nr:class II aldolase/adducin family protein [Candidatus Omnitrophota bacterium]
MTLPSREKRLKAEIIDLGKQLVRLRLICANVGNLSARLKCDTILITRRGSSLDNLKPPDILKVDLSDKSALKDRHLSSEFPLHSKIYRDFPHHKAIIHCHPPLTNAYFSVFSSLRILTVEAGVYLGRVPVIRQKTPTITDLKPVLAAFRNNNLVVIKNHGVVCAGSDFKKTLLLVETLESAVKVAALSRLFRQKKPDGVDKSIKQDLTRKENGRN